MKKLAIFLTEGIIFASSTPLVFANQSSVDPCQTNSGNPGFGVLCKLGMETNGALSVGGVLGAIINVMFVIAAIIALWFLVQGGIRWITSQGDTKNVEGARNQIMAAAVGMAVTFLAYLIINLLLQFFLGTSLNSIVIPQLGK